MKIPLLILYILISTLSLHSQSTMVIDEMDRIKSDYSQDEFKAIFERFSPDMKGFLPEEKTTEFFSGLKMSLGNIRESEWIANRQGFDVFKTMFDNGVFDFLLAVDSKSRIVGLSVQPHVEHTKSNESIVLDLPLNEEWFVFWGGDTREQNYHIDHPGQTGAYDMVIVDENGSTFKGDPTKNENYYAFGKELLSPCQAEVWMTVDGVRDNVPGIMNPMMALGNCVVLKTKEGHFIYIAHLKQNSVKVKQGDIVNSGDLLGLCGNSGNSSEAHLHIHVQDRAMGDDAQGIKCGFKRVRVNDSDLEKSFPVKGDKIAPSN